MLGLSRIASLLGRGPRTAALDSHSIEAFEFLGEGSMAGEPVVARTPDRAAGGLGGGRGAGGARGAAAGPGAPAGPGAAPGAAPL